MKISQEEIERHRAAERLKGERDAADLLATAKLVGQQIGRIQLLQQLLEQPESSIQELRRLPEPALLHLEETLKRQLGGEKPANGTPPANPTRPCFSGSVQDTRRAFPQSPSEKPPLRGLRHATGTAIRLLARAGTLDCPTSGLALGYVQANLVVVQRDLAFDFLLFCQRNPKPCPLLDVTDPGSAEPRLVAPGADLCNDLPRYRIYQKGELLDEPTTLSGWWRDDLVGFLIGCSFTFEQALLQAGLPLRHLEMDRNVPMYRTNIPCRRAGVFHGPMVVSMRPLTPAQAVRAVQVCSRFPRAHGAPVHIGDPAAIGVRDLDRPDYGEPVEVRPGEVPVFWACGVTPQAVALEARPSLMMTHKPGYMFLTDLRDTELEGE